MAQTMSDIVVEVMAVLDGIDRSDADAGDVEQQAANAVECCLVDLADGCTWVVRTGQALYREASDLTSSERLRLVEAVARASYLLARSADLIDD